MSASSTQRGRLRIGVLGAADIAARRMLPAFAASPDVELVAVASRDRDRAAALAGPCGVDAVAGYAPLLDRSDVDAVYVPLPPALHARWVEAALLAGKHVLAEKPLTADADTTARLVGLAVSRGLVLRENVMFVHHSQHAAVARLLAEGAIGEVRSLTATFTIPPRPAGDVRLDAALGGGGLIDTGVYPVHAALHLLGDGWRVAGAVRAPEDGLDLGGDALLRGPGGVTAHLRFGIAHAYSSFYEIHGTTGRIRVEHAFTPPATAVPDVRLDGRPVPLEPDDQVGNAVAAFAAAAAHPTPPDVSVAAARLIDAIRTSSDPRGECSCDCSPTRRTRPSRSSVSATSGRA